jgi:hypothetical protein
MKESSKRMQQKSLALKFKSVFFFKLEAFGFVCIMGEVGPRNVTSHYFIFFIKEFDISFAKEP